MGLRLVQPSYNQLVTNRRMAEQGAGGSLTREQWMSDMMAGAGRAEEGGWEKEGWSCKAPSTLSMAMVYATSRHARVSLIIFKSTK